jgi:hypothetical protein
MGLAELDLSQFDSTPAQEPEFVIRDQEMAVLPTLNVAAEVTYALAVSITDDDTLGHFGSNRY